MVNEKSVETVTSLGYLGLQLDSHLTWRAYIDSVVNRIKPIIGILHRARDVMTRDVKLMLYYSMIHTTLTYMIELWGASSFSQLKQIQVLQNRALRNIYGLPPLEPRVSMYENPMVKVLPLQGIYERALSTFVFKTLKGENRSATNFNTPSHSYLSRNLNLLVKPRCYFELCKGRMSYAGPSAYNALPEACKTAASISKFRNESYSYYKGIVHELLKHY